MGYVKKQLMEAECNGHIHPLIAQVLGAFQPGANQPTKQTVASASEANPYKPVTIWALYADGALVATYLHKSTAEYELWVSRTGEEVAMAETPTDYTIAPLPMHTHLPD